MNTIGHLEIPANDVAKTRKFYESIFDWEFHLVEEMNYLMFTMKDKDGNVVSGGGIPQKQDPAQPMINYINVDDLDASTKKIEAAGGTITLPKTAVPGMGWFVQFTDPEGNPMAIWQDDNQAK